MRGRPPQLPILLRSRCLALIPLQPKRLDETLLLGDLPYREVMIILAVQIGWLLVELRQHCGVRRIFHALLEGVMEYFDDLWIHVSWATKAIGRICHHIYPDFFQCRHHRPIRCATSPPGDQKPQLALVHHWPRCARVPDKVYMTTEDRNCRLRAALEWNVNPIDALMLGDLRHPDMHAAANARRSVGDLTRVCFRICKKFLNRLPAPIVLHHNAKIVAGKTNNVGQVFDGVERHLSHVRRTEDVHRNLRDRIAVGICRSGHMHWAKRAGSTRPVLDYDGLTETFFGCRGDGAHRNIGWAAGRPRHDHGHRADGKALSLGSAAPCDGRCRKYDSKSSADHNCIPLWGGSC